MDSVYKFSINSSYNNNDIKLAYVVFPEEHPIIGDILDDDLESKIYGIAKDWITGVGNNTYGFRIKETKVECYKILQKVISVVNDHYKLVDHNPIFIEKGIEQ